MEKNKHGKNEKNNNIYIGKRSHLFRLLQISYTEIYEELTKPEKEFTKRAVSGKEFARMESATGFFG